MRVVITGGSRGIGAAAVRRFAGRGDEVAFLYEKEHEAARAVAGETGALALCADVAAGEEVAEGFVMMCYSNDDGRYYYWDMPDDILAARPSFSGKIGYICEYDG